VSGHSLLFPVALCIVSGAIFLRDLTREGSEPRAIVDARLQSQWVAGLLVSVGAGGFYLGHTENGAFFVLMLVAGALLMVLGLFSLVPHIYGVLGESVAGPGKGIHSLQLAGLTRVERSDGPVFSGQIGGRPVRAFVHAAQLPPVALLSTPAARSSELSSHLGDLPALEYGIGVYADGPAITWRFELANETATALSDRLLERLGALVECADRLG